MLGWLFGRKSGGGDGAVSETRELITLNRSVDATPAKAFEVFVDRLATWWPKANTWAGDKLQTIVIEPKYGGRCYERGPAGEQVWGKVLTVDRPSHLVYTWQIRADRTPEPSEASASRVDLRFIALPTGKTEVLLVHRDFPRHGDGWEKYKADMAKTWPGLMDAYLKALADAA